MKRLALLLLLAGCAMDGAPPGAYVPPPSPGSPGGLPQEAALPPTAHEWDHGPPWETADKAWASTPDWATVPTSSWAWGGSALGPWAAAPTVSIGIGTGWWWGYRPWPRSYGWWGPTWAPTPVWRPYAWAYRPAPWGWRQPAWGGYRAGWHGGWGHRGGWRGGRRW